MAAQSKPLQLTPLAAALAGALGGCFSTAVVYPLDVAKTRIQALPKSKDKAGMLQILLRVYKHEGISGFYKGFGATMLNTFSQQYAYFFFYSFVRSSYINRLARKLPAGSKLPPLSTAAELLFGAIAGALAQIFTIPVAVIATRQQVGGTRNGSETPGTLQKVKDQDSFLAVGREIIEEEGVTGLWLGLKPGLVLTVNPAITYGVFERLKSLVLLTASKTGSPARLSAGMIFLLGSFSKTLATVVTYPYIMAKVRIQARTADVREDGALPPPAHARHHQSGDRHPGALDILVNVFRKEGFVGWYQGMSAQITKAVLSQALLFLSKDQFEQWAAMIMILLARFKL